MPKCVVKQCSSRSDKNNKSNGVSFYRIPRDQRRSQAWINNIRLLRKESNWLPSLATVICSKHFKDEHKILPKHEKGLSRLTDNAVPIVDDEYESMDSEIPPQDDRGRLQLSDKVFVMVVDEGASTKLEISPKDNNVNSCFQLSNDAVPIVIEEEESSNLNFSTKEDLVNENSCTHNAIPMVIDETEPLKEEFDLNDVETDEEMREILESPRKRKMQTTINRLKRVSSKRLNCIKKLRLQNKRLKIINKNLTDLVKELKNKRYLSEEEEMQLGITHEMCALMKAFQNSCQKKKSFKKFPLALKKFSLSLNFYSPAAYKYVRSALNNCLPHPRTLLNWYSKINGEPGFTAEAFDILKEKSQTSKTKIICNLVIDEMAIRQQKIFDGKKHHGFVNYGVEDNNETLASSALVFLLVCLDKTWKLPVAHFFTHGLTGKKLATLINMTLEKCAQTNIDVASVTCDGSQVNIAAMRILGCKLDNPTDLKPIFKHPTTGKDIVLLLDACHMLKLVRNSFEAKQEFIDKNGNEVKWHYVQRLQELQDSEGLRAGNRLTCRHINFRNQIMKVKLATQVLSNSVAQSLIICKDLSPEFTESVPTAQFIKLHNDVFDVLNSRGTTKTYGFKRALNPKNRDSVYELVDKYKEYICNLKVKITTKKTKKRKGALPVVTLKSEIKPVLESKIKTGFLGLLVCLESLKILYKQLVETKTLKYIATYRLSQDHLEIFFGCIRQKGGHNNNPNVLQFKSAYKKMLNHLELTTAFRGNCMPLEKINILNCTAENSLKEINKTLVGHREEDNEAEENDADLKNEWEEIDLSSCLITGFTKQIVGYIAGYVVSKIGKEVKCEICLQALLSPQVLWFHKVIKIKDNGGLCYPTQEVYEICLTCESIIKFAIAMSGGTSLHPKYNATYLATKTLEKIHASSSISKFAIHSTEHVPAIQMDHPLLLIKAIIDKYIKIRFYHESKTYTLRLKKETKRQMFNKLTLHSGV